MIYITNSLTPNQKDLIIGFKTTPAPALFSDDFLPCLVLDTDSNLYYIKQHNTAGCLDSTPSVESYLYNSSNPEMPNYDPDYDCTYIVKLIKTEHQIKHPDEITERPSVLIFPDVQLNDPDDYPEYEIVYRFPEIYRILCAIKFFK